MKLNVGNTHTLKKINTRNILLALDIILLLGNARCACTEHVDEFGIIVHAQMVCTFLLKVYAGLGECTLEVGHENNTASRKEEGGRGGEDNRRATARSVVCNTSPDHGAHQIIGRAGGKYPQR